MRLGERVAAARKRLGINQAELARRAALAPAAVWQIEHGDRRPSAGTLRRLADALEVSADWLLDRPEAPAPSDPRVAALYRGIERLSRRDREAVLRLYEILAGDDEV